VSEERRTFPVELRFPDGSSRRIEVGGEEHIWDAARREGIALPSTCLQGWCISCAGLVLSGDWDQRDSLRYFPEDRAAGFILLCTARPRSALSVRTHQKDAMRANRLAHGRPAPLG